jgi:hypothetical protein
MTRSFARRPLPADWPAARFARFLLTASLMCLFVIAGPCEARGQLDQQALAARGLTVTRSPHLTLVTDARNRRDVAEFNEVFEQAVGQWCRYFDIPVTVTSDWHLTGCVVMPGNESTFAEAGLWPDDLPPFPAGFQRASQFWIYLQDGDYYTRHLLIHEGTHAFMERFLGGYGAPWYAEGIAELLAVHAWSDGRLQIRHAIRRREEVPFWGRVKLVRQDRDADRRTSLDEVLNLPVDSFRQVRHYGWAWAACEFFDSHPEFQESFRQLASVADLPAGHFNRRFLDDLGERWPTACREWEMMVDEIDYGYDVARAAPVEVRQRVADGPVTRLTLAVDRGWQKTGIRVAPGRPLKIDASGKFLVKHDGQPWPSDAGGITIEYYRGRPLGRLLAAISFAGQRDLQVMDVGTGGVVTGDRAGELYLRINESPSAWRDNEGQLSVTVQAVAD